MSFALASLRMLSGGVVWALHFAVIYGFTGLACARGLAAAVPWVVGGATLVAAAACVALLARAAKRRGEFDAWMTGGLAAAALLAVVWEGLPVLLVPPCV